MRQDMQPRETISRAPVEILLAPDGITSWTTRPHAICHDGRTYFAYQSRRHVEVNCYDHATGEIGSPVVVHTYARDDDHGTPSLFVVPAGAHAGKLVIMYAHHSNPLYARRSTRAEDISAWDAPVVVDNRGCNYPNPIVRSDGSVWMSYRLSRTGYMYRTTSDGTTWSPPTMLIENGYLFLAPRSDTFHLGYGRYVGDTSRFHSAFHARSDDGGRSWTRSDSAPIDMPITPDNTTCAYDDSAGIEWSRVLDIALDADGTPAMLFYTSMPNFRSGSLRFLDMTVSQLRWDGSAWQGEEILTQAPYHRSYPGTGGVYACSGAQKPGDTDTVVLMEGQHGVYSGGKNFLPSPPAVNSDFSKIERPCRARAVLYRRSDAGWRRVGPLTNPPETWADPTSPEAFETRPQWVRNAGDDLQFVLSRVTRYLGYTDWHSSLIGVTVPE